MKTKTDKENEVKKWTTFMQKPDRPIPKSKADLEFESRIPYKVNIVKQPKPRCDPSRAASPPPTAEVIEETPIEQANCNGGPIPTETEPEVVEASANEESTNVDDCEKAAIVEDADHSIVEDGFVHTPPNIEPADAETKEDLSADENQCNTEIESNAVLKSAEDILLEKQLANVQKQLQMLSTLPTTIQATLDAVSKQLEDLIPAIQRRTSVSTTELVQPLANDEGRS